MIRYLTDEHIPTAPIDGLVDRGIDVVRVQDVELNETPDPDILEWAANQSRIFVSLDRHTLIGFAYDRVLRDDPMPGVVILDPSSSLGLLIEELQIAGECGDESDFRDRVVYVPFR